MPRGTAALAAASIACVIFSSACSNNTIFPPPAPQPLAATKHVLLLSVDGLHAFDLGQYISGFQNSALRSLSQQGIIYSNATAPAPTNEFPGLAAMVSGGTPKTTGVYYDLAYDRALFPPGSNCSNPAGTVVQYRSNLDVSLTAPNLLTGIDETQLPEAVGSSGCAGVYPHDFIKVNTAFEVVKANMGRTAWADEHPADEIVNGPSGTGVDDLFLPEIDTVLSAPFTPGNNSSSTIPANTDLTANYAAAEAYDDYKVAAIVNQINGLSSDGTTSEPVPTLFGMSFQAVSVAQVNDDGGNGGYSVLNNVPGPKSDLAAALAHTDASIARILAALNTKGLLDSTLIIVAARCGNSPVDVSQLQKVSGTGSPGAYPFTLATSPAAALGAAVAQGTEDDISLVWLKDQTQVASAVGTLQNLSNAGIFQILSSISGLPPGFGNPASASDTRSPDIVVEANYGVLYSTSATAIAGHGGFAADDQHVALLVSIPGLNAGTVSAPVSTTQVAPTILQALGIGPAALQAVKAESTAVLPGLF